MISLYSPADYPQLDGVHPLVARYLKNYCNGLLQGCNVPDLAEIGGVFLLQTAADLDDHYALGLSQPLEETLNERTEVLVITSRTDTVRLLCVVFALDNSRAVDVFMPEALPPATLKAHLCAELAGEILVRLEDC